MGATLPLLTDFFRRDLRQSRSWRVGLLYAANTFGAALGIIAATFFLIELMGIRASTLLAAFLNFSVAFIAFQLSNSTQLRPMEQTPGSSQPLGTMGKLALVVLAASGGIALASEVL